MSPTEVFLEGDIRLHPTQSRHHKGHRLPYVVAVADATARHTGRSRLAVLERLVDGRHIGVIVGVVSDESCGDRDLRLDQTIRTALGLPLRIDASNCVRSDLRLVPLEIPFVDRVRNRVSGLVGRRYLLVRAAPPRPTDIEKRICRLSSDDLAALGSSVDGRVVLFGAKRRPDGAYALGRFSVQALGLDGDVVGQREGEERLSVDHRWDARYVCPTTVLGVDGTDLAKLFIDSDIREELGVGQAWPVLARRDSRSAISSETQDFGIALLTSFLALDGVLGPILEDQGWGPVARGVLSLAVAVTAAALLVIVRLRSDLH
jgi:hypothetical protein